MATEPEANEREEIISPIAWFRAMQTTISQRLGIATAAGQTFAGKRDVYAALGYPDEISLEMYRGRYERGGIAGRIVDAYPNQTWRGGGVVTDDMNPDSDTPFEAAWTELEERLKLWPSFNRTDILAGLGDFAVLLIGGPGEFPDPLPQASAEEIVYVQPYSQIDVMVESLISDAQDPRFGQPETYKFKRIGEPKSTTSRTVRQTTTTIRGKEQIVHWTRVLHVADGILDDAIHGLPRLRRIWNHLEDLDKVIGGGAEAFWNRAHQGYVTEFDKDLKMTPDDMTDLAEQMDAFANKITRYLAQRGAKTSVLGSDVAEFHESADAIVVQISAATGIPHRILTGSERGELASSQDRNNWNERIGDRRQGFAESQVVRPFVDRMLEIGALPAPSENEYAVKWPEIKNLDEGEKAEVAEALANVNKAFGSVVITEDEIRIEILDLPPLADVNVLPDNDDLDADEDETLDIDVEGDNEDEDAEPMAAAGGKKKGRSGTRSSAIWARTRALKTSPNGWRFMQPRILMSAALKESGAERSRPGAVRSALTNLRRLSRRGRSSPH